MYADFPYIKDKIGSNGKERRILSNAFDKLPVFTVSQNKNSIAILGRENSMRLYKWIDEKYIVKNSSFDSYKVIVPTTGPGTLYDKTSNTIIGMPIIGTPNMGYTQTFISLGAFNTKKNEAEACCKYIKTKFARTLIGAVKITQDIKPKIWRFVPLQDFTSCSDIDWSKTIPEIDQQLYRKYGFSQKEIDYIETHIQEMS